MTLPPDDPTTPSPSTPPDDPMLPPLRADVRVERSGERNLLVDDLLGRRLPIDDRGAEAAAALDVAQPLSAFCARLGCDVASAQRIIALFTRVQLLDTEAVRAFVADRARALEVASADPATVPLLIREDARFGCTMCGSCCGGHNIGPVFEDTLAALAPKLDALAPKMRVDKGWFFEIGGPSGEPPTAACHTEDGTCVFLTDARRCLIHQELGGDSKPRACQLFPYQFIATPAGVAVSLQSDCRGFPEARQGPRLVDQEPELRRLLAKIPSLTLARTAVTVHGTRVIPWEAYEALERRLHDAVDAQGGDDVAALVAMREVFAEEVGPPEPVPVEALGQALHELCVDMIHTTAALRQAFGEATEREVVHTDALDGLDTALRGLLRRFDRVTAPLDRAPLRALFVDYAHHHLMGKHLTKARTLTSGLARFSFSWLLAKSLAFARARAVKRRHLVAQDVQDGIVVVSTMFRSHEFVARFSRHEAAIDALGFDQLSALLVAGPALTTVETRVEIHKF